MADGFIVRKGGAVTEQALAPTITEVSTTETSITFTITNNDASTAVILYEVDDATPDENSIELATGVTSDSIEITGLTGGTEYTVSATASVTGKVLSNVVSLAIETDPLPVYTAATGGTTEEYDSGGKRYKSHTFTSNGDFEVTTVGDAIDDRNKVDYLIIAGGASGGRTNGGSYSGGGGAGGYRTTFGTQGGLGTLDSKVTVTATSYGVTIGAGGSANTGSTTRGNNGANTTVAFPASIVSTGGGGGGSFNLSGNSGGSGGGGGGSFNQSAPGIGTGTTNQGFNGGLGIEAIDGVSAASGGGGGGAGQVGSNGASTSTESFGGNGGDGLSSTIRTGSAEFRAGGGGGRNDGLGGLGGGTDATSPSDAAAANSGSGTGATSREIAGAGGSGIVIIRYEIAPN
jgi:hypothetical protein